MTVFDRIKLLADKQGKSLNKVEEELGLSKNVLYRMKNSDNPTKDRLEILADYFNVSVDYLLGRKTPDDTNEPVSFFRIDTTNLSEDEILELQDELEEYQEFIKQKIKNKRNRMD